MILSTTPKRPTKRIKVSPLLQEGKTSKTHLLFRRTATQDQEITIPTHKSLWTDPTVDSQWPKTKDSLIQNKSQNLFQNQQSYLALDFTQLSQQSVGITKSFHKTETSTRVPNSCCQKMSLVELIQSLRGKYVSLSLCRQSTDDTDRRLHLV